jgi:hypothetical protein
MSTIVHCDLQPETTRSHADFLIRSSEASA